VNGLLRTAIRVVRTEGPAQDAAHAVLTALLGVGLISLGLVDVWNLVEAWPADAAGRWLHAVPLLVGAAAMLIKRKHPMIALAVGVVCFAADLSLGGSLGMIFVLFDLLYAAGLHTTAAVQRSLVAVSITIAAGLSILAGLVAGDVRFAVWTALQVGTIFVIPLWWAVNVRQKSELAVMAAERADLERARAEQIEQIAAMTQQKAIQAERAAMARDLHDVIASHLSATAIHSGAALAGGPDPERDRNALESVRSSSLAALTEMRSMIMLLRADRPPGHTGDPIAAPARLGQLEALIEDVRNAGLEVELVRHDADRLPTAVDQAAYRIVQESLTNAVKYADGNQLWVEVQGRNDHLRIRVENQLRSNADDHHPALSTGTGLWSMRERAEALGGRLSAGVDGDRWVVEGEIPYQLSESEALG
jgi:signal transduction histidine kinase